MALGNNEAIRGRAPVQDGDGRLVVVGPNGVAIGGGGGGGDPLSDGDPGGALPTKTLWIAGADGTVLRGVVVDSTGRLITSESRLPSALNADGGLPTHVQNFPASQAVTGPLTDTQLRASAVPVSGPLTDTQLRASAVPISGALTDTQLRASAVPVSGPLTDTQLRASAVPVSGTVTANQGTANTAANAWPITRQPTATTPTQTNVAASATSVTLKASNASRKGLMISNQGTAILYVNLAGAAATTTTANSFPLSPNQTYVMDENTFTTGTITGIWAATGGNGANVTEFA